MAKTAAPYDPAPVTDTDFAGKPYHWTFALKRGAQRAHLVLHRGSAAKCKRIHRFGDGDKA